MQSNSRLEVPPQQERICPGRCVREHSTEERTIPGKSRGPERLSHSGGIRPAVPCNAEMGMNPKFPSYPSGCSFDTDRSSCMSPVIYRVLAGQETCVTPFGFSVLIFTCCGKIKWIPVQLEDPACTGVLQEYHCSVQFKAGWMLWMTTVIIKTTGFSPPHFNLNEICQIVSDDLFPRQIDLEEEKETFLPPLTQYPALEWMYNMGALYSRPSSSWNYMNSDLYFPT